MLRIVKSSSMSRMSIDMHMFLLSSAFWKQRPSFDTAKCSPKHKLKLRRSTKPRLRNQWKLYDSVRALRVRGPEMQLCPMKMK